MGDKEVSNATANNLHGTLNVESAADYSSLGVSIDWSAQPPTATVVDPNAVEHLSMAAVGIDPMSAVYEKDVHLELTGALAFAAGLPPDLAARIAGYDQYIDE